MSPSIPARPANSPCTCVWPLEHARLQQRQQEAEAVESKFEAISNPVQTIVSKLPDALNLTASPVNTHSESKLFTESSHSPGSEGTTLGRPGEYSSIRPLAAGERAHIERDRIEREDESRLDKKRGKSSLAAQNKPDVLIRSLKKRVTRSSENKTRSLFSYREDLVIILRSLVPVTPADVEESPLAARFPDLVLCRSCLSTLAHGLYYSPARYEVYLSENSTRGFLALVDDAVASLEANVQMESLGHHELERILVGELAVCEWRIATKLARYHKKTDFLNLFPAKVGEFAELRIERAPPSEPEGIVKRTGKAALRAVGIGSAKPTPQSAAVATGGE